MLIRHAVAFLPEGFRTGLSVRLENGRVAEMSSAIVPQADEEILDAEGAFLLPGFVDVHIHAFKGHDTMSGEEAVRSMSRDLAVQGVAAFLPTTMSASEEDTRQAIAGIRAVMDRPEAGGARVLGAHMEAPFLQPGKCGAQVSSWFQLPDMAALERLTGGDLAAVKLITMAPGLPGGLAFIENATAAGLVVSIGHTGASGEVVHEAAGCGAAHVTHTFNAQTPLHHREPGVPGAALTDDRLYCEIICDGIHLHPDILSLVWRAKGAKKALAVTDAMEAAGMPDGQYSLGGQPVYVERGQARLEDGTLAGSVLTMPQALMNLIRLAKIPPADAVRMCTLTPAESIGCPDAGRLQTGAAGPLTLWSDGWTRWQVLR